MTVSALYATAALGAALLVYLVWAEVRRRRRQHDAWRDWCTALTPRGERTFQEMYHRMQDEVALLDIALLAAVDAQQLGSTEDAVRLLDAGGRLVESHAPNMRRLLLGMAVLSRMVSAMAPVAPLRPANFNLRQLVGLAQLNRLLHHMLVTTGERFRFRVQILRTAFMVVLRYWLRFVRRVRSDKTAEAEAAWRNIEALRKDIHALTDESLATFRVLVLSLSATPEMRAGSPQPSPFD